MGHCSVREEGEPLARTLAIAALALGLVHGAAAQAVEDVMEGEPEVQYEEVVVTAKPPPPTLFELATPAEVLEGEALAREAKGTLGDTLGTRPGVAATQYAPGASRPVVRGLDGARVRILQNGVGVNDASQTSPDHAVSLDPSTAERVEIVRGPATLLYGSSAIGGVVNVIDNRIPDRRMGAPIGGTVETRASSIDFGRSITGTFQGGVGGLAYSGSAFTRRSEDVGIPGFARSAALRAAEPRPVRDEPRGEVPNSAAEAVGGAVGLSWVGERGYLGVAPSTYATTYGAVAEEDVTIDLTQRRLDLAGGLVRPLPSVSRVKARVGLTDYEHTEFERAEVATVFSNEGFDARLEVLHERVGPFEGAVGFQSQRSDFDVAGAEAYLPPTLTQVQSGFLFEEVAIDPLRVQLGVRLDYQDVHADAAPGFAREASATFLAPSGAVGLVHRPREGWVLTGSVACTQRAPNGQELFANGPHVATDTFEIGDRDLAAERAVGVDVGVRRTDGRVTGGVGAYYNRFTDFIALLPTGRRDPDDDLPVYVYRNVPARFAGFEADGAIRLLERGVHALALETRADYVWAENRATGEPLPRIPPLRFGGGLVYRGGPAGLRLEALRVQSQRRHARQEYTTDGYTMLDTTATWDVTAGPVTVNVFLRGTNLLDAEARNSVSFLKDIQPLAGRGVVGGIRVTF